MPIYLEDVERETDEEVKRLKATILEKLSKVKDPEIGIDVVNLGLVYGLKIDREKRTATIEMTLTTPTCPYAPALLNEIQEELAKIDELDSIHIELVWEPPWNVEMMSEKAKILLGYHGRDNP